MSGKNSASREALLRLVNLVRPALASAIYIPALTHIKFDGEKVVAFNDVSAISVRGQVELACCVPGELLLRTLNSFGGESVLLQHDKRGGNVVISSGRSKVTLPVLELKDFPFDEPTEDAPEVALDANILKGIERCLFSVGNDPTHPAQMGVTLDCDERGCVVLYSTDNFTISRYVTKTERKLPGGAPVILPRFFCEQLVTLTRAFPDDPPTLWLYPGAHVATFGKNASLFTRTLVDLIPLDFPTTFAKACPLGKVEFAPIPDAFDASLGRALLVLEGELDKSTKIALGNESLRLRTVSKMGDADDVMGLDGDFPDMEFFVDPTLVLRASKTCAQLALLPKVLVLASEDQSFIHLISHCAS